MALKVPQIVRRRRIVLAVLILGPWPGMWLAPRFESLDLWTFAAPLFLVQIVSALTLIISEGRLMKRARAAWPRPMCPKCLHLLTDEGKVCPECGLKVTADAARALWEHFSNHTPVA